VLTEVEKKQLLEIAREAIRSALEGTSLPEIETDSPALEKPGAAFVTLRKHGELRGCIGTIEPRSPLYRVVQNMAVQAASADYRFEPVTPGELDNLSIEISVLSPPEPLTTPEEIIIGTHGLIIEKSWTRGLLLPQVASERGWTAVEFLENVCLKAGLPPSAWKDPDTKLWKFTATVFSEDEMEDG